MQAVNWSTGTRSLGAQASFYEFVEEDFNHDERKLTLQRIFYFQKDKEDWNVRKTLANPTLSK